MATQSPNACFRRGNANFVDTSISSAEKRKVVSRQEVLRPVLSYSIREIDKSNQVYRTIGGENSIRPTILHKGNS